MQLNRVLALAGLLAGFLLSGCDKDASQSKKPSSSEATNNADGKSGTNVITRDLGQLTLTNHQETCILLGAGRECWVTPKVIDAHNVQLTLKVKSRAANGRIHDFMITQVAASSGKPLQATVGGYSFSLTPNVILE